MTTKAEQDKIDAAADAKQKADAAAAKTADAQEAKDHPERAEAKKKHAAAVAEAAKARQAAVEARQKAIDKDKTPEQKAAEEAERKADDADAKAAALHPDANPPEATSAVAGAPTTGVKLNIPGHPAYALGVPTHDEAQTVSLFHMNEDNTERVYTRVHPDMVGDYLRAGWGRV